jgi:hypothetical protein
LDGDAAALTGAGEGWDQPPVAAGAGAVGDLGRRVRLLEGELAQARGELARLSAVDVERQLLLRELEDLRTSKAWSDRSAVERRAADADLLDMRETVSRTVSFRLGAAILAATRSPAALFRLPAALIALRREVISRRRQRLKVNASDASQVWYAEQTLQRVSDAGADQALAWLGRQDLPRERRGELIVQVARSLVHSAPETAFRLAMEALDLEPASARARWVAFALFDFGFVNYPNKLLRVADLRAATPAELKKTDHIKSLRLEGRPAMAVRRSAAAVRPEPRTLLLVANHSMPHHVTAQTLRDHATAAELGRRGWRVVIATERAYLAGKERGAHIIEQNSHEQDFIRLAATGSAVGDYAAIAAHSAHQLVQAIERLRPSCVVATGDVIMAEAAVQAARRCGVGFIYDVGEVRGPWKTPARRELSPERAEALLQLMGAVARQADCTIVRTGTLCDVFRAQGVPAERLRHLPDPDLWPAPATTTDDLRQAFEIAAGVVLGSISDEVSPTSGHVELIQALGRARASLPDATLMFSGALHQGDMIRDRHQQAWPDSRLVLCDRVAPKALADHAAAVDIWVEPPPLTRCNAFAAPVQLQLPMRLGRPVVAPDTAALREQLQGYAAAFFYDPSSFEGLGAALAAAAALPEVAPTGPAQPNRDWTQAYLTIVQGGRDIEVS